MENQNDLMLEELYQEWINDDLRYFQFIKAENQVFYQIREKFPDNSELVEMCREAIFDNEKLSKTLVQRIKENEEKIRNRRTIQRQNEELSGGR